MQCQAQVKRNPRWSNIDRRPATMCIRQELPSEKTKPTKTRRDLCLECDHGDLDSSFKAYMSNLCIRNQIEYAPHIRPTPCFESTEILFVWPHFSNNAIYNIYNRRKFCFFGSLSVAREFINAYMSL